MVAVLCDPMRTEPTAAEPDGTGSSGNQQHVSTPTSCCCCRCRRRRCPCAQKLQMRVQELKAQGVAVPMLPYHLAQGESQALFEGTAHAGGLLTAGPRALGPAIRS